MLRTLPAFSDLRSFISFLEKKGSLKHITEPVSIIHDMTEIHRRVLHDDGPALLFDKPVKEDGSISPIPVLVNLFGTVERIAWGLGIEPNQLKTVGEALSELREPRPPQGVKDMWGKVPLARAALKMRPKYISKGKNQELIFKGDQVDLSMLPIQTNWSHEPAPLITWGLVITRPPDEESLDAYNVGVYRMQIIDKNKLIMRWLAHRGGAKHHHQWGLKGERTPVAIAIGADPATILTSVIPLPETLSEIKFSGLFGEKRPLLSDALTVPLKVPADSEIIIEGYVSQSETAPEGPYGDHTGYYNAIEHFPVMEITAITMREKPIYLSTYTGRPPDEPSRLGEALNEIFLPIAQRQFPEIINLWLPPEACSYRMAVIAMKKRYPGHARRLMLGLWSMIPQLTYTKTLILVDEDIDVRSWEDVMWAVSTRSDPSRDLLVIDNTPIDYLDFASPKAGLGGKLGIDATMKIGTETERIWGKVMVMENDIVERIDNLWPKLGLKGMMRPNKKS